MNYLNDMLGSYLGGGGLDQIAQQADLDPHDAARAIQVALPALAAGLAREVQDPQRQGGLFAALDNDHDGSLLASRFGQHPQALKGERMLEHIFGQRKEAVAQGIGQAAGLDSGKVLRLLIQLAPVLMAVLGNARRSQRGSSGGGGLMDLLGGLLGGGLLGGGAPQSVPQPTPARIPQAPRSGELGGVFAKQRRSAPTPQPQGGLGSIFDADGDGQVADDLARIGSEVLRGGGLGGLLGGLLGNTQR